MKNVVIYIADQEELKYVESYSKILKKNNFEFYCLNVSPIKYWYEFALNNNNIRNFTYSFFDDVNYDEFEKYREELGYIISEVEEYFDQVNFRDISNRKYNPSIENKERFCMKYLPYFLKLVEDNKKYNLILLTPYVVDMTKQLLLKWATKNNITCVTFSDVSYKDYHLLEIFSKRKYGIESHYYAKNLNKNIVIFIDYISKMVDIKNSPKNSTYNLNKKFNINDHRLNSFGYHQNNIKDNVIDYYKNSIFLILKRSLIKFKLVITLFNFYVPTNKVIIYLFRNLKGLISHVLKFILCEFVYLKNYIINFLIVNKKLVKYMRKEVRKSNILVFMHYFPEDAITTSNSFSRHELSNDYVNYLNSKKAKKVSYIEHPIMLLYGERSNMFIKQLKSRINNCNYIQSTSFPPAGFDFNLLSKNQEIISLNGSISFELSIRNINSSILAIHPLLILKNVCFKDFKRKDSLGMSSKEYLNFVVDNGFEYLNPNEFSTIEQIDYFSKEVMDSFISFFKNYFSNNE